MSISIASARGTSPCCMYSPRQSCPSTSLLSLSLRLRHAAASKVLLYTVFNIGSIHFRFYHQARSYDLNLWPCKFLTTNPSIRHQYGLSDRKGIRTVKKIISGNTIQVVVIATNCTLNPLWPKQRTIIQQYGDWYTGR